MKFHPLISCKISIPRQKGKDTEIIPKDLLRDHRPSLAWITKASYWITLKLACNKLPQI